MDDGYERGFDHGYDNGRAKVLRDISEIIGVDQNYPDIKRRLVALMGLARTVADAYDSKPDYWCSCMQCENFKEHAEEVLDGNYWRDE
jgi:hypothetical protein